MQLDMFRKTKCSKTEVLDSNNRKLAFENIEAYVQYFQKPTFVSNLFLKVMLRE